MKTFFKNVGLFVVALIGAITTFFVGKFLVKSVAKSQEKLEMRVILPPNVRSISNAGSLNELVNKYPIRYSRKE